MPRCHPCSLFLIPLLDDFRRAADGDALWRDVVGDGGMAADDAAVADGDAGEDRAEFADPDVVLDDDGFALRQGSRFSRPSSCGDFGAFVPLLSEPCIVRVMHIAPFRSFRRPYPVAFLYSSVT